ncbi:MAG: arginine deiminase family protein [Planctomycetota bacterium]
MVHVTSEVGRLRTVLVHRPGSEVDLMVPSMMEDLLFDDILFGEVAREEHRKMRAVFELAGVEVLEAEDLLIETLRIEEARRWLIESVLDLLPLSMRTPVEAQAPVELAEMLVSGLRLDPSLTGIEANDLFEVAPLPNWCFQRDPIIALPDGLVINSMATAARAREAVLASGIFRFHPRFEGVRILRDAATQSPVPGLNRPCFEGGDFLVLSKDVVAVGLSERTNLPGIRTLARTFIGQEGTPRWMVVVTLPQRRAYMHLDTIFTPVDRDACLVHAPVILAGGSEEAHVYEIDLGSREPYPGPRKDLLSTLARHGIDLEPIACGGSDAVRQQREQWTDGANAFALAPGVICLYDRNVETIEALAAKGFAISTADELLEAGAPIDLDGGRRCILIPSHELSRARGGPHCMTHPLERDDV